MLAQHTSPEAQADPLVQPEAAPLSPPPLLDAVPESSLAAPESLPLLSPPPEDELLHPEPAARARPRREVMKRMLLVCIVEKPFVARGVNKAGAEPSFLPRESGVSH